MEAVTDGKLADIDIRWKNAHCACVVLASGGYPSLYKTGFKIGGLDEDGTSKDSECAVYHAGTEYKDGAFYTAGGRVIGVSATASALNLALEAAYKTVGTINFEGVHYRRDIGKY